VKKRRKFWKKKARSSDWVFKVEDCLDVSTSLIYFSVHGSDNNNSFHTNAIIMTPEKNELIKTQPLVNSGAGGIFMDQNYAWKHGFNLTKLEYPITA
jgi:hypothetical protein